MTVGYLALTYVLLFLIIFCGLTLYKKNLKNNIGYKICVGLFPLMLAIVTTFFVPLSDTDLRYQFQQIEQLREVEFSTFFKDMFDNAMWGEYLIFWIFSRFKRVELYPFFFTTVIVGMVLILGAKNNKKYISAQTIIVSLLIYFAGNDLSSVFGGGRNRFVNGLIVLCIYEIIVEKKKALPRLIIATISCFVHGSGVMILIFAGLTFLLKGMKKVLFVFIPLLYPAILNVMEKTNNSIVQYFTGKIKYYFEDSYELSFKMRLGGFLLLIFILMAMRLINQKCLTIQEKEYSNIVECYALFGIGCVFAPHIMLRQAGLCCCAILPLLSKITLDKKRLTSCVFVGTIAILINYTYGFLTLIEAYNFLLV